MNFDNTISTIFNIVLSMDTPEPLYVMMNHELYTDFVTHLGRTDSSKISLSRLYQNSIICIENVDDDLILISKEMTWTGGTLCHIVVSLNELHFCSHLKCESSVCLIRKILST